jgi:hypothetical protein
LAFNCGWQNVHCQRVNSLLIPFQCFTTFPQNRKSANSLG